jgi:hypothetical protein
MLNGEIGFVISNDNQRMHVGTLSEVVDHTVFDAQQEGNSSPFANREVYDSTGTLMDPVPNADGSFTLTIPSGRQPVNNQHLIHRIAAALANIQVRVDNSTVAALAGFQVPFIVSDDLTIVLAALNHAYGQLMNGARVVDPDQGTGMHGADHG